MYFEESWYVVLRFRLNCFQDKLMTSDDQSKNAYDFEEGEIIDDDEPSNELPAIKSDFKQSGFRTADCRFPSSNSNSSRRPEAFRRRPSATNQTRPPYSESRSRESPGFRNFSKKANSRRRQNDLRKCVVTPRILRKQNIGGRSKCIANVAEHY